MIDRLIAGLMRFPGGMIRTKEDALVVLAYACATVITLSVYITFFHTTPVPPEQRGIQTHMRTK